MPQFAGCRWFNLSDMMEPGKLLPVYTICVTMPHCLTRIQIPTVCLKTCFQIEKSVVQEEKKRAPLLSRNELRGVASLDTKLCFDGACEKTAPISIRIGWRSNTLALYS